MGSRALGGLLLVALTTTTESAQLIVTEWDDHRCDHTCNFMHT